MNFAQTMRLIWIDMTLEKSGSLRRATLCEAFGISVPQAAADIKAFSAQFPNRIEYDKSAKCYRPATAGATFDTEAHVAVRLAQIVVSRRQAVQP